MNLHKAHSPRLRVLLDKNKYLQPISVLVSAGKVQLCKAARLFLGLAQPARGLPGGWPSCGQQPRPRQAAPSVREADTP